MDEWINPPAGVYSREEFLEMNDRWRMLNSADQNKLAAVVDPFKLKFLGNKRVVIDGDRIRLLYLTDVW